MNANSSTMADIFNLDAYPIHVPKDQSYKAMVEKYRHELDEHQCCILPNFITNQAIQSALMNAKAALPNGYQNASSRNCYLQRQRDPEFPDDHPRNIFFDASYCMIANDLFPESFALKQFYHSPEMIRFVEEVTRSEKLYVSEDPYQPVNVLCAAKGNNSAWHFDSWNSFTMTLCLQSSEEGGEFEYVPGIRSKENPNIDELRKVLKGDRSNVVVVPREPGALVIFRGSRSVHRVTEVKGDTERLMGVFVYETEPGIIGEPEVNATVYGPRTSQA